MDRAKVFGNFINGAWTEGAASTPTSIRPTRATSSAIRAGRRGAGEATRSPPRSAAFPAWVAQHAAAALRRPRRRRHRDPRAQGGAGRPARARGRQDAARGDRRGGARRHTSSSSSPARRCASRGEMLPSVRPGVDVEVTREPIGVVGDHHAVEFPDRDPGVEDRAGAGLRQLRRVQAGRAGAGVRLGAGRDPQRAGLPAGRVQPGDGHAAREVGAALLDDPRIDAASASPARSAIGRSVAAGGVARHGEVPARDGRQESAGRARRRRPRRRRQLRRAGRASSRPASAARRRAG